MAPQTLVQGNRSLKFIWGAFVTALALISLSLVNIQLIRGSELAAEAASIRTFTNTLHAKRGDIVDAKGTVLATTVQTYDIAVNQQENQTGYRHHHR